MCTFDACDRLAVSRGWCRLHYQRWQRYGDPSRGRPTLAQRLHDRSASSDSCALWQGARDKDGYGLIKVAGVMRRAHRVAYEVAHAPIPAGMVVMHSCDNPPCVRLSHLSVGTVQANVTDAIAKGRRPQNRAPFGSVSWTS